MRKRASYSEQGFTVFELVFVLCILGILWLIQLSALHSLSEGFRDSFEKYTVSSVQVGILTYWVDPNRGDLKKYPDFLDFLGYGLCSEKRPCFEYVVAGGVTGMWKKKSPFEYKGPSESRHFWKYDPSAGQILMIKE